MGTGQADRVRKHAEQAQWGWQSPLFGSQHSKRCYHIAQRIPLLRRSSSHPQPSWVLQAGQLDKRRSARGQPSAAAARLHGVQARERRQAGATPVRGRYPRLLTTGSPLRRPPRRGVPILIACPLLAPAVPLRCAQRRVRESGRSPKRTEAGVAHAQKGREPGSQGGHSARCPSPPVSPVSERTDPV